MSWLILLLAGLFENGWANGPEDTEGFTRVGAPPGAVLGLRISMGPLGYSVKSLPVGTAYAIWVGVGAVGTAVLGMVLFGEPANLARLLSLGLIIAGIIGLKLAAPG